MVLNALWLYHLSVEIYKTRNLYHR